MRTSIKENINLDDWFSFFEKLKIGQVAEEIIEQYKAEPSLFLSDKVCYQVYSFSSSSNLFLSKSVENMTGYTVEEGMEGMPFLQRTTPQEDAPKMLAICQSFCEHLMSLPPQQISKLKFHTHTRLLRKDGKTIWIRHNGCYFGLDHNNMPSFFAGFLLDVTDQITDYGPCPINDLFAYFLDFGDGRRTRIGLDDTGSIQLCAFTKREIEVMKFASQGLSSKLIASRLDISVNTVNNHKSNIMNRIGSNNMIEAVAIAKEKGFI